MTDVSRVGVQPTQKGVVVETTNYIFVYNHYKTFSAPVRDHKIRRTKMRDKAIDIGLQILKEGRPITELDIHECMPVSRESRHYAVKAIEYIAKKFPVEIRSDGGLMVISPRCSA